MAVTIINNQPIRFRNSETITSDCECLGQSYCQLINQNDETQFQILSSDELDNGGFDSNLDNWTQSEPLSLSVSSITSETGTNEDGEIIVSAAGGTAPYTYSKDGTNFQSSSTFSNLPSGTYTITVRDSNGLRTSITVIVGVAVDCGDYQGFTLQQMIDAQVSLSQLYNCTLDDLKP